MKKLILLLVILAGLGIGAYLLFYGKKAHALPFDPLQPTIPTTSTEPGEPEPTPYAPQYYIPAGRMKPGTVPFWKMMGGRQRLFYIHIDGRERPAPLRK